MAYIPFESRRPGRLVVKLGGAAGIGGAALLDDLAEIDRRASGMVLSLIHI